MVISYAITAHNETEEINKLLEFLIHNTDKEDEIVILDDFSDEKTQEVFTSWQAQYGDLKTIKVEQRKLNKNFAEQKNYLTRMCKGSYIMNIDADEMPHQSLMKNIKTILEANPTIDLYWVPRVNTVDGIDPGYHLKQWGWTMNEKGWVNWPDYQGRIWRNRPNIMWKNKVHEVLTGYKEHTFLPQEEEFCFYHPKTIERQEKQNEFYKGIQ